MLAFGQSRRIWDILTEKRRPQPSQNNVHTNSQGNQEDCCIHIHPCESGHDGTSTQEKLARNENVGEQCKENEDDMRGSSIAAVDDLEKRVAAGCILLDFAGKNGKHEDLDCCSSGI